MANWWDPWLQTGLNIGSHVLNAPLLGLTNQGVQLGSLTLPNSLVGAAALAGGEALGKEPGEVTQARQFERNTFTSPTFLPERVSQLSQTNQQYFDPLLTQRRNKGIADISQRFAAAFPTRVGAQGPEFGAISDYVAKEALPSEMNFYGQLGLRGFDTQQQAARDILQTSKPDPFAQAISQLGGLLIGRDLVGTPGSQGPPTGPPPGQLGVPTTGPPGVSPGGGTSMSAQVLSSALEEAVGGFGRQQGNQTEVLDQAGRIIGYVGADGTVTSLTKGIVGQLPTGAGRAATAGASTGVDMGLPGPGLLGPAGAGSATQLLSSAGSGAGGFFVGQQLGPHLPNQATATLGGAAGGAATGFAVGGPLGAVIGAVAGAIGGFKGKQEEQFAFKAQRLASDQAAQANNVAITGSFWTAALGGTGVDTEKWNSFVQQVVADPHNHGLSFEGFGEMPGTDAGGQDLIAQVGARVLLREVQKTHPEITDLDQLPGFRDQYINYFLTNYRIESGGRVAGVGGDVNKFGGLLMQAGVDLNGQRYRVGKQPG